MRGATKKTLYIVVVYIFQSTRPMRGATCGLLRRYVGAVRYFNPRAPCGARLNQNNVRNFAAYFNPRAPCGARLVDAVNRRNGGAISIHAPHAGRDRHNITSFHFLIYFNPRAPCGARPRTAAPRHRHRRNFNPRAPCGARPSTNATLRIIGHFNPRAPCGARLSNHR